MHKVIGSKTFSRILLAIDKLKTSTANKAIDYAVHIAQDYDARLIILHVIRADIKLYGINPPRYIIEMSKQAQADLMKIIEKISEDSAKNGYSLKIKTDIIASIRVADAIIGYAKDKHIDLIILQTRDTSKLKSVFVGNVATDVIRYAHCPVLTIK
jgi:nucleotide-binding universal stress UspA family protein